MIAKTKKLKKGIKVKKSKQIIEKPKSKEAKPDIEFLKKFEKLRETASKKSSEEISSYSKEIEEFRATGRKAAKVFEEIEECKKIAEEFKVNPPIVISKHINDISVEYRYEDQFKTKIELLKKHGFPFLSATKNTSTHSPTFTAIGKAYVKRRGRRIPLPESSIPPLANELGMGSRLLNPKDSVFVLENGDVIETENDAYVTVNDFISNDKYNRKIFVYPNSEVSLILDRKESHPEPSFMDPSQVPDVIKRNCSSIVIEYNFVAVSLVKGIFHVNILDENKDVNRLLKLPSGYPGIEFLHSSKMIENIQDKIIAKMPANVLAMYKARMPSRSPKVCDEISTYIELCRDGSIVIFGTPNPVKNKSSGKIASPNLPKVVPKDFIITGKITVAGNRIYSDASDEIDPRARAIIKNNFAVGQYSSILVMKKEYEQKLKELKDKKSKPIVPETEASKREKEKRKAELKEELDYYRKVGDSDMVAATQMQLDEFEPPKHPNWAAEKKELREEIDKYKNAGNVRTVDTLQYELDIMEAPNEQARWNIEENYILKRIDWCDEDTAKLKPDLNTNFPRYNPPKATDEI